MAASSQPRHWSAGSVVEGAREPTDARGLRQRRPANRPKSRSVEHSCCRRAAISRNRPTRDRSISSPSTDDLERHHQGATGSGSLPTRSLADEKPGRREAWPTRRLARVTVRSSAGSGSVGRAGPTTGERPHGDAWHGGELGGDGTRERGSGGARGLVAGQAGGLRHPLAHTAVPSRPRSDPAGPSSPACHRVADRRHPTHAPASRGQTPQRANNSLTCTPCDTTCRAASRGVTPPGPPVPCRPARGSAPLRNTSVSSCSSRIAVTVARPMPLFAPVTRT